MTPVSLGVMTPQLADVPTPTRGSGPVECDGPTCQGHRARCLFGGGHAWTSWYENGRLMRTTDTYRCRKCDGICTGEEDL